MDFSRKCLTYFFEWRSHVFAVAKTSTRGRCGVAEEMGPAEGPPFKATRNGRLLAGKQP